jgi:hypothetical protein
VPSGSRMLQKGTQNITTKRQLARPIDGNGRKRPGWDARHNAPQSEVESPRHYVRLAENSFVQARKLVIPADSALPATVEERSCWRSERLFTSDGTGIGKQRRGLQLPDGAGSPGRLGFSGPASVPPTTGLPQGPGHGPLGRRRRWEACRSPGGSTDGGPRARMSASKDRTR